MIITLNIISHLSAGERAFSAALRALPLTKAAVMYSDGRRRPDLYDDEGYSRKRRRRSPPQYRNRPHDETRSRLRRYERDGDEPRYNRVEPRYHLPEESQSFQRREHEPRRGEEQAYSRKGPRERRREAYGRPDPARAPSRRSENFRRGDSPRQAAEGADDARYRRRDSPGGRPDDEAPSGTPLGEEGDAPSPQSGDDKDRMARLFEEAGVTTIAEYNQFRKERGEGVVPPRFPRPREATQAEIDQVLPILEPLPEAYQQAILAIPGCLKQVDTRHIKTLLRLSPRHAMEALHEFREAVEDVNSNIRNIGGYMMGVLRKYLPGEVASGMTYDGTAVSELEKSLLDTETFADPWKKKESEEEEENRRREEEEAARLRKSPRLPSDIHDLRRLVRKKAKEASRWRPVPDTLHAWQKVEEGGGERVYPDGAGAPLTFSTAVVAKPIALLVEVAENPPHPSLHADQFTANRSIVYRYDARTALIHEHGAIAAPFVKPHDRATVVAWRKPPPSFQAAPGSWMRLRFSVTTALVPEQENVATRAPVPIHAWLLEPLGGEDGGKTRCTTWGVEELPSAVPNWLNEAATIKARRAGADFEERLNRWIYKLEDPHDPALTRLQTDIPDEWTKLADREDNIQSANNNIEY